MDWLVLSRRVCLSQQIKFFRLSRFATGDRLELSRETYQQPLPAGHQQLLIVLSALQQFIWKTKLHSHQSKTAKFAELCREYPTGAVVS